MSSISKRVKEAVIDLEHQVWRALRESGSAVLPYLAPECVMLVNDQDILDSKSKPSLQEFLESEFRPWTSFDIYDIHVVEIDMMAAVVCYKVIASVQRGAKPPRIYQGLASSTWKQEASAEWKLCSHHQSLG
ncbi:MAG: hypothetical protein M1839_005202 [Geoglossum umbratile]|nr:MAG: hypothetical protein M1839_005202 [Geoglossum umbratile]